MKKQLLFVMLNFPLGGISKALLSLFYEINFSKYEVDLLLFKKEGLFINGIPKEVNVISNILEDELFSPHPINLLRIIRSGKLRLLPKWLELFFSCVWGRLIKGFNEQLVQNELKAVKFSKSLKKEYDAAIAFASERNIYYIIEKISAKKKIGWVHGDYEKYDKQFFRADKIYYPKLDYLVTISEECANILRKNFKNISKKIIIIKNICSRKQIKKMSIDKIDIMDYKGLKIATACRISIEPKGLDLVIKSAAVLKCEGIDFKWWIIGDGPQLGKLIRLADKHGVLQEIEFLGAMENPYPYINNSDIYVQPSRYEGKAVAIDEAKALCKPIVVTNFSTVNDQIQHGINGIVVDMDENSIANGIKLLNDDRKIREKLINNLQKEKVGNEEEIEKFLEIIM